MEMIKKARQSIIPANVNGKKVYIYNGKQFPTEFGWFLVLKELKRMGMKLRVVYSRDDVRDDLTLWEFDREFKGFAPSIPLKVEVYRKVEKPIKKELRVLFGEKKVKWEKVMEIRNVKALLDPEPEETLNMMELIL